jgi:single-strand DNA-binding protein
MSKSVNKVILVGNVGKDPEVRYSQSGTPVAKFSLATNEKFKDRNDQWQDRTEWHNIVAWQRLAEIVGEFVAKGSKIYIEGKLQTSCWEDGQSGERKYRTEIIAREIVLLGTRTNGGSNQESSDRPEKQDIPSDSGPSEVTDEDIPF